MGIGERHQVLYLLGRAILRSACALRWLPEFPGQSAPVFPQCGYALFWLPPALWQRGLRWPGMSTTVFAMCLRVAEVDNVLGNYTEVPRTVPFLKKLFKKTLHCTNLFTFQQIPMNTLSWVGTGSKDQYLGTTREGQILVINFRLIVAAAVGCPPIFNVPSSIVIETLVFSCVAMQLCPGLMRCGQKCPFTVSRHLP